MVRKISGKRWEQAEELFGAALELPLEERDAFLDRHCESQPTLRHQVSSLLAADDDAERFLAEPALGVVQAPTDRSSTSPGEPQALGPYRLIRQIGEGGMSKVWLAVRADQEVRRRVAIKCLRHSMATEDLRRRLRRERQILASLDHANIARLFDVGTTAEDLPYFVMEYIEGEPITTYCDQRRLRIEERLRLFRAVCGAVHYAHQNLIVHCDIKPTNILVTADGTPKLLDFGVAKWLNPELTSDQLAATLPWQQFLTPDYASPEQIQGRRATTASDVYSLGVLLYELLAGQRPYHREGRSPEEVERRVRRGEPTVPSLASTDRPVSSSASHARRSEPHSLRRRLAGDLDNIVAYALRPEPQRRYSSAEQFSDDLRRHLIGMPVMARPSTFGYRARRFVHRNRVTMGVAAAFVALLIGATVSLGILSIRLTEERDTAHRERAKATSVADFLLEIFELTGPDTPDQNPTALEILDRGAKRLTELGDQPELQAALMRTIGSVYSKLGFYDEARKHLESALEIQRRIFETPHLEPAQTLAELAQVRLLTGELESAEVLNRDALAVRRELQGEQHPEYATALCELGKTLEAQGHYEEAEDLCRRALAIHRETLETHHPALAESIDYLAVILFRRAKYQEAEPLCREALARRRALLGSDHPAVAESLNTLSEVLKGQGDYAGSERLLTEALEINRQRLGEYHIEVAATLNNLASLATYQKDHKKAEVLYQDLLDRAHVIFGEGHPNLAFAFLGLGSTKSRLGDHQGAESLLRRALEIRSGIYPAGNHLTANAQTLLGDCLTHLEQFDEAEALLLEAFEVYNVYDPPRWRQRTKILQHLVSLYETWNKPEQAVGYQEMLDALPPLKDAA